MAELSDMLDAFRTHLGDNGLRLTSQREAIARVFFSSEKHLSLQDLLDLSREEKSSIGYATVYRTMRLLTDAGFAIEHRFDEDQARYEPAIDRDHHDHLICVDCGKIVEFEDPLIEQRQVAVAQEHGFELVDHKLEIYVRCLEGCASGENAQPRQG